MTLGLMAVLTSIGLLAAGNARGDSLAITNFQAVARNWEMSWPSMGPGMAYTVQYQDTLADGIWRLPGSEGPLPLLTNWWRTADGTNSSAFFRVLGVPAADRGKLISATYSGSLPPIVLSFLFNVAGIPITPQYSVLEYKLTYETITPWGARTTATGALLLPQNLHSPLPLVSYQHGTVTQTNKAPSSMDPTTELSIGLALATSGYAASLPDYLGLGDSPGLHPYHHARSEATACVDMLRAVRAFCTFSGFTLTNRLFLCGYSQGGHATMALLRELETYHTNEFTVTACAPMAGAYDLSGVTAADFLSGRQQPAPYYFLYLLAAYQDIYHLAPSLADLLASPYDSSLPPLLDGNTSGSQIDSLMPSDPTQILKPEYLAAFSANPRHPLRLALQENDVYRWKPVTPIRLYHCAADQDVVFANSQVAYDTFLSLGDTQVQLIDPLPSAGHVDCAEPSLMLAKEWFDSLQ